MYTYISSYIHTHICIHIGDSSEKIHDLILHKEPDFSTKMFPKAQASTIEFLKMVRFIIIYIHVFVRLIIYACV
jgi:hypothetical protein